MAARNKMLYLFLPVILIAAQLACSVGGFTISKDGEGAQPQSEQPSGQPTAGGGLPAPTRVVVVNTPTSSPSIQVAPPQPGTANAVGRVLWNGGPVVGVEVKLCQEVKTFSGCEGTQFSTVTDDQGYYVFANVTPGEYVVIVHAVDAERWIYITAGLSLSGKKHELAADQTLTIGDQHIYKFDLRLTSPAQDEKVNQATPTLTWDAYPGAAYYEVYLDPRSGTAIRENVTENKFTVPQPLLNCEYTWTVEVFNEQKIQIAEHEGYGDFQVIGQPASCEVLLTAPLDGTNLQGEGIEFSWQAHPLATHYMLYVYDESYKNVVDGVRVDSTTYKLTQALPPGEYKWYIAAYAGSTWIAASDHYDLVVTGP